MKTALGKWRIGQPGVFWLVLLCLAWWGSCGLFWPGELWAAQLRVSFSGVKGEQYENVLARVALYQQRDNPRLTAREIRRLHGRVPVEVAEALAPFGYFSPLVSGKLEQDQEGWRVDYVIDPGLPVLVSGIVVEVSGPGNLQLTELDLSHYIPFRSGDIFYTPLYEQGKKKLLSKVRELGFIKVRLLEHEVQVYKAEHRAEIRLHLETGPQFLFGETRFGWTGIDPELLARYFPHAAGDPYSLRRLVALQSTLNESGYFSDVQVIPLFDETLDLHIPIALSLTPGPVNRYSFGLGYGTDTGARGSVEWRNRLLNSRGHQVRSSLQLSENIRGLEVNYEIPIADPRTDRLVVSSSWVDEQWDETRTELLSGVVALQRKDKMQQVVGSLELRDESYDVGVTRGHGYFLLPTFSWVSILAKDRIVTRDGLRLSLILRGAEQNLLSDATFLQGRLGAKLIVSPFENWRFLGRFALGATVVDEIGALPPSLRFYSGGDQSVRGYGHKSLGPVDRSGAVIGGRYLLEGSAEIEHLLDQRWSVAAFYDAGNAMDDLDVRLAQGLGLGVRIQLPFGRISIDLATALSESGHPLRLHVSLGADL